MPWLENSETDKLMVGCEERFRNLMNNPFFIIAEYDFVGKFLYMNKRGQSLLGYTLDEIRNLSITELIKNPGDVKLAERRIRKLLNGETLKDQVEYELVTKYGVSLFVEAYGFVLYNKNKPFSIQIIAKNITVEKATKIQISNCINEQSKRFSELSNTMLKLL